MKPTLVLSLVLALGATSALAQRRSASLLSDAPLAALGSTPHLLPVGAGAMDVERTPSRISLGELFVKTSAVGVAATAAGTLIGAGLGALTNNLYVALLTGGLLGNILFPAVVTVLAEMLMGNVESPGRFGFWLPFAGAVVVNIAVFALTSLVMPFATAWSNPVALLLYSLVDGVLMSGASTGLMALTEQKPVTTVRSFVPGVGDTTVVSFSKVEF